MPAPPGDPQRPRQAVPVLPEDAGQFEHRRVAGRVVADPDVPRVEVTVEEDEFVGYQGARNLGDQNRNLPPAGIDPRRDGDVPLLLRDLDQLQPVPLVDAEDRHCRLPPLRIEVRRPPDRRADTLVDRFAGIDEDAGPRPRIHHVDDPSRRRHPIGDHDLADDVESLEVETIRPIVRHILPELRRHVNQLSGQFPPVRRDRHRRRLRVVPLAARPPPPAPTLPAAIETKQTGSCN